MLGNRVCFSLGDRTYIVPKRRRVTSKKGEDLNYTAADSRDLKQDADVVNCDLLNKVTGCTIKIYRTIIVLVILCGCETWSLLPREEHRLRVLRIGC